MAQVYRFGLLEDFDLSIVLRAEGTPRGQGRQHHAGNHRHVPAAHTSEARRRLTLRASSGQCALIQTACQSDHRREYQTHELKDRGQT